jgi:uncharacterized MAPEG superfamily protein
MKRFTLAYWIVLFAALLPIVCAGIGKWGQFKTPRRDGGFDNHSPRNWWDQQSGWRARANAAQNNTFEALPFFFVAVVVAHQFSVAQIYVDLLAIGWLLLRCGYVIAYLADAASVRSSVWLAALALNIALLLSPLWGR